MSIRELLGTTSLVLGTVILFKLFWGGFGVAQPDGSFVAATTIASHAPLQLEVDFIDKEQKIEDAPVHVKTDYADMTFSSAGGTISDLTFIRKLDHKTQTFHVWNSKNAVDREQQPFLVALEDETPYYYKLVSQQDNEDSVQVVYESKTSAATIKKIFTVDKHLHKIDFELTIKPQKLIQPRLVWPSPYLQALEEEDTVTANVIASNNKFKQIAAGSVNFSQGFVNPTLFGTADKYFAFIMVKDAHNFAQRAYYKSVDKCLLSFLEAKPIEQETTWNVSFYFGAKEPSAMGLVDSRLDKILNYGLFSFVSKLVLKLLHIIETYTHNYGWAIIIVTILIRLLLLPFNINGEKSRKKFEANQKQQEYISQKYKHDPEKLEQARIEHMQKHGMGGMLGCALPVLLQMPFFWGLMGALNNSIQLYRAPFIFWIKDLSLPDPYYVLPLIAFIGFVGSALMGPGKKDMKNLFPQLAVSLVFGSFMATMSAGVTLYFATTFLLQFGQTQLQKAL
ncbi:MAG: YidC/Oxa1 family membrane protein insertase [Alteromonas naphthalenivorans]|jgi:YidC/Oxa1 family membrane protein insertase